MDSKIKFYCINLKHRTDRWNTFSNQKAIKEIKEKHNFERFEAVAGSTVDVQNDSRISMRTKRNIKESLRRDHEDLNTTGGIGCYLSHTDLWRKIADGSEPFAIIFEDDTKLPDNFLEIFERCFNDKNLLPEMPDVWTFSHGWDFYYKNQDKLLPHERMENHRGPWIFNTCPGGLNGYFITKDGAKKLLESAFPIDMHVDLYICLCTEIKNITCVAHKDLILSLLTEGKKSDIQLPGVCAMCDIPNNFQKKGLVLVNLPIVVVAAIGLFLLSYVGKGKRR